MENDLMTRISELENRLNSLDSTFKQHKHLGSDLTQRLETIRPVTLTSASAIEIQPVSGSIYILTPASAITVTCTKFPYGIVTFIIKTSGTTSYTLDFETGFTTTATLTTGTVDGIYKTITFVGDGLNLREIARTAAMTQY